MIDRVAQVELREEVSESAERSHAQLGMLCDLTEVFRPQNREEVRFAAQESRQRRREIGRQTPDQATESGGTAIIRGVSDELDGSAGDPAHEAVLSGSDGMLRRFRASPTGWSDWLPYVLRHDRILINRVVELLRRPRVKPENGGCRVRCADRIDVGDHRCRR